MFLFSPRNKKKWSWWFAPTFTTWWFFLHPFVACVSTKSQVFRCPAGCLVDKQHKQPTRKNCILVTAGILFFCRSSQFRWSQQNQMLISENLNCGFLPLSFLLDPVLISWIVSNFLLISHLFFPANILASNALIPWHESSLRCWIAYIE